MNNSGSVFFAKHRTVLLFFGRMGGFKGGEAPFEKQKNPVSVLTNTKIYSTIYYRKDVILWHSQ